jgi:hypothetical protein
MNVMQIIKGIRKGVTHLMMGVPTMKRERWHL